MLTCLFFINDAVVRAAGRTRGNAEGLASKGPIGGRHHDLRRNLLLAPVIQPRELSQSTARPIIGISRRLCEADGKQHEPGRKRDPSDMAKYDLLLQC